MASIVSAGTTSATALNMSADTTGILQLATNNGTTAVTIDTSQNVGIGTASPIAKLDVRGSGAYFYDNSTTDFQLTVGSSVSTIGTTTATPLAFKANSTERMRIDSNGYVTTPFQPSFCAYNTGAFTISSGGANASPYSGSAFNATQFNVGSCFNISNARFTAPVAGKYLFNFVIYASTDPGVVLEAKLWINAQEVRRFYNRAGGNINNESASITATMSLSAGDYVQWGVYCTDAFDVAAQTSTLFNYFDGYLIG